jgi:hypothetical protein
MHDMRLNATLRMSISQMAKLPLTAIWLLITASLLSTTVLTQTLPTQIEAPPPKRVEIHVLNYGDIDTSCLRWTDQCRICTRGMCSNIGIACQPGKVGCLEHLQSVEKDQKK